MSVPNKGNVHRKASFGYCLIQPCNGSVGIQGFRDLGQFLEEVSILEVTDLFCLNRRDVLGNNQLNLAPKASNLLRQKKGSSLLGDAFAGLSVIHKNAHPA